MNAPIEKQEIKRSWGWFFALGLLLILLGLAMMMPALYKTTLSTKLLGFFLTSAGVGQLLQSFIAKQWKGLLYALLLGILYVAIGVAFIINPVAMSVRLTLWVALFCFVVGLARMLIALIFRYPEWGWTFFNGCVTLILGGLIYSNWPFSGLWVIGLFIGLELIISGFSWLAFSLTMRKKT